MELQKSILPDPYLRLLNKWAPWLLALLFLLILIRTAWLCDDAYITYRTVDNALHGHGLRFNVSERVQSYTHPLWMFLHLPVRLLISDMYLAGMVVSIGVTVAAMAFASLRLARGSGNIVFMFLAATMSRAFMDYSTSGLENPLSHLLIAVFAWIWLDRPSGRRRLVALAFVTGLMLTNRMDTVLLVGPALAWAFWRERSWRNLRAVAMGLGVFLLWEVFSVVYYGFPFPNTAYAKLNHGFGGGAMLEQGWYYLVNVFSRDPITPLTILSAAILAFAYRQKHLIPLVLGMLLYTLYVVKIGGGFMSGRFFTGPFFMALLVLVRLDVFPRDWAAVGRLAMLTALLGWLPGNPTLLSGKGYSPEKFNDEVIDAHGIADERAFYYPGTGLLHLGDGEKMPNFRWADSGKELAAAGDSTLVASNMGFLGYYAGPGIHLIDFFALTDPLLARIPSIYLPDWRPGHFGRMIPPGYKKSVESGENQLRDPALGALYEDLKLVTRGPLFSKKRWAAIWRLNLGIPQSKVNMANYRLPVPQTRDFGDLSAPRGEDEEWNAPGNVIMSIDSGVRVDLPEGLPMGSATLRMCSKCWYVVVLRKKEQILHGFVVNGRGKGPEMMRECVELPATLQEYRPDELLVYPLTEWRKCSLSDVQFGTGCPATEETQE